jgi:hypothetical protein
VVVSLLLVGDGVLPWSVLDLGQGVRHRRHIVRSRSPMLGVLGMLRMSRARHVELRGERVLLSRRLGLSLCLSFQRSFNLANRLDTRH